MFALFLQVINKLPVNANTSLPPFLVIWCGVVLRMGGDAWERLTFGMLSFICAWKLKHLLISISKVFCLLFNDMLWIIFWGNMTLRYFFKKCILSSLGYIIASSFIALRFSLLFFKLVRERERSQTLSLWIIYGIHRNWKSHFQASILEVSWATFFFKWKGQFSFIFTDTTSICHYVVVLMNYFI